MGDEPGKEGARYQSTRCKLITVPATQRPNHDLNLGPYFPAAPNDEGCRASVRFSHLHEVAEFHYRLSSGRIIKKPAPKADTTTNKIVVANQRLPKSDRDDTFVKGRIDSGCSVNSRCLFGSRRCG